jgi:hypothetical protein
MGGVHLQARLLPKLARPMTELRATVGEVPAPFCRLIIAWLLGVGRLPLRIKANLAVTLPNATHQRA